MYPQILMEIPCTFCGAPVKRFPSQQINPKTGKVRKVIKCRACRRVPPIKRFWALVKKNANENGCWLWQGGTVQGYGSFTFPELREYRAHRISYRLAHNKKPIPDGLGVLHKISCHNRGCVNPNHLYLGTHSQNCLDSIENGTHPSFTCHGENAHHAKLSEAQAIRVLKEYRRGNVKQLAQEFAVSEACLHDIRQGRSWRHLKLP